MTKIKEVTAREILNSLGNPTVEATIVLSDGTTAKSSVASGISKSVYEAAEIHDAEAGHYKGMGVQSAIKNITDQISPHISGIDIFEQQRIDRTMIDLDGTPNKSKLGANAILAVSQAAAKAAAKSSLLPLCLYLRQYVSTKDTVIQIPLPEITLMEGGRHAPNGLNFQDFLCIPASSKDFRTSFEMGVFLYQQLKETLSERILSTNTATEGGFAPQLTNNAEALSIIKQSIESTKYVVSRDVFLGIDAAANNFYTNKVYKIKDRSNVVMPSEMVEYYKGLVDDYAIISIEDPFAEGDMEGWKGITETIGDKTMIVGNDLITTNPYRLQQALDNKIITGVVINPSEVGTVTESIAFAEIARYKNLKMIVSARGAETDEDFLADFAVAIGADYVKFGAPTHERVSKYNRMLAIADELEKI